MIQTIVSLQTLRRSYVVFVSVYISGNPAARCMIATSRTVIAVGSTTLVIGVNAMPITTSEAMVTKSVLVRPCSRKRVRLR